VATAEEKAAEWLTHAQVARRIGRSIPTIRKMRDKKQLSAELIDGTWRFDPEVVERVADELGMNEGSPPQSSVRMGEALDTLLENNQKLFDVLFRMVDRDHAYIEKLESTNHKQREDAELARTQEHERELERKKLEHEISVKEKALASLTNLLVPYLLQKLSAKNGAPAPAPAANDSSSSIPDAFKVKLADQMLSMLATLDADALAKLKEALPAEHFEMVSNVVAATRAA
jgi:hypothetical protein